MCYSTTSHFTRCSHRTSTIALCPRSTHRGPTTYHPSTHRARPCVTPTSREGDTLVRRDGLCEACSKVSLWFACGGGGGRSSGGATRSDGPGASRRKKDKEGPVVAAAAAAAAAQMAGVLPPPYDHHHHHHHHHHHSYATHGRAAATPRNASAGLTSPIPTGVQEGRCPLSEAFERAVAIAGDEDGRRVDGSRGRPGGVGAEGEGEGEGECLGGGGTQRRMGGNWPFKTPLSSPDAGNGGRGSPGAGFSSCSGGCGGHAGRKARRAAGEKHVRFAPKVEVLYFMRDWATGTLRSLGREYEGCR